MSLKSSHRPSRFLVQRTAMQGPYADATLNVVQFDTELFDELGEMAIVAPYRFTPRRAGWYYLHAQIAWNLIVGERSTCMILLNGGVVCAVNYHYQNQILEDNAQCSTTRYLTPNDYVDVRAQFDVPIPPVNRSLYGVPQRTYFTGFRIG